MKKILLAGVFLFITLMTSTQVLVANSNFYQPWPAYSYQSQPRPSYPAWRPYYQSQPELSYEARVHKNVKPAREKIKILFLSAGHVTPAKIHLLTELGKKQDIEITHFNQRDVDKKVSLTELMSGYQLLLFDTVNANEAKKHFSGFFSQVSHLPDAVKTVAIRWPQSSGLRKGVTETEAVMLEKYFSNGGRANFKHMLSYIKIVLFSKGYYTSDNNPQVPAPIIYPELGIYHPDYKDRIFARPDEYLQWYQQNMIKSTGKNKSKRSVVAITIHQESLASENMAVHNELIRQIERAGAIPLAFYYRTSRTAPDYVKWLSDNGKSIVDVVINTRLVHWAEKRLAEFKKMGVTVLHALAYTGSEQEWREDKGGIPSSLIPFYLTLSEMAGLIDPVVISAKNKQDSSSHAIKEQLDLVVRKALRIADLRTKANAQKKVAILYYNYPPGEKNASASFLNITRSIEQILKAMKVAGYNTSAISEQDMIDAVATMQKPFYRDVPADSLLQLGMGDSLPLSTYKTWFVTLPKSLQKEIVDAWGEPEKHFMVSEVEGQKHFIIPIFKLDNLVLLPQPPRGNKDEREKSIYHSKNLPINHYYLAVYLYLRQQFGVDALVHLGTHGSHEWLPGKERGLWAYDPGSLTADDIPVIYPYIVDDVGEALQAKRRGRAVMISHMTPPFAPSGLYRELSEVHELMHQYGEVDPGLVKKRTRKQLIKKLQEMDLLGDMGWKVADVELQFAKFMDELHDYMHDLATANQPLGLHTWGQLAEDRLLVSTIMQILGNEFADAISKHQGGAASDLQNNVANSDHKHTRQSSLALVKDQSKLENLPGFSLLYDTLIRKQAIPADVSEDLQKLLIRSKELLKRIYANQEMASFLTALDGGFIQPSTGGDPIRNEDSLPTGRNLYGFDPSRVPTKAAWESGKQLVESMIIKYYNKHGKYPDKMAFSLWSIETMRHYGVLESQALYAMGLRPVWAESGRIKGTEIISYSELKRPRVDVVLSATGLYRDAFPNVMKLMAEGIDKIAKLKEENNFVYRHSEKLRQELIAQGKDKKEAEYLSTIRIFSGASGRYGTGLNAAVLASDSWENDNKLATMYMDRMGYAFGTDQDRWGEKVEAVDLYAKNLSGTDMALFSRSSNLYGLLTSDDPFQYLGGISLAVRNLDGKDPEMYISNLRNPNQEKIQSLNQFLSQELRSRYFHPRWIKEMQKEGYSGTLSIVDTLNNFWGWQVVDPQNIRDEQWHEFFEVYVEDKYQMDMKKWFEKNNPDALAQIVERMLEAVRKEYWKADEKVVKKLVATYEALRQQYDIQTINKKFTDYVAQKASGYGLKMLAKASPNKAMAKPQEKSAADQVQQVKGQKLEKVEEKPQDENHLIKWLLGFILLIILAGAVWQVWREDILLKIKSYQSNKGEEHV